MYRVSEKSRAGMEFAERLHMIGNVQEFKVMQYFASNFGKFEYKHVGLVVISEQQREETMQFRSVSCGHDSSH